MCKVFFIRSRLVASVLILLCGGSVYAQQPATRYLSDDIPKAWTPDTLFSQQLPPEDLWWSGFNDACLDTLIQEAALTYRTEQIDFPASRNRQRPTPGSLFFIKTTYSSLRS